MGPGLPEITALVVIALITLLAFADAVRNLMMPPDDEPLDGVGTRAADLDMEVAE